MEMVCVCVCVCVCVFVLLISFKTQLRVRLEFNITLSNKSITKPYSKLKSEMVANGWIFLKRDITYHLYKERS